MANSETMVTYSKGFDLVLIKADDSYVIVGDTIPTVEDLEKMIKWEDVKDWEVC